MFVIDSLYTKYVKHGNKTLYMCFIDFKKAYDKVWRYSLLLKLLESGVSGTLYSIIEDKKYVKHGNKTLYMFLLI